MSLARSDLQALRRILLEPLALTERIGQRREGRREGAWTGRYVDGTLAVEGRYVGGRRHGVWRRYGREGEPTVEIRFHLGVPDGRLIAWWPGGEPALEVTFRHGELEGHVSLWDRAGRLYLRSAAGGRPEEGAPDLLAARRAAWR